MTPLNTGGMEYAPRIPKVPDELAHYLDDTGILFQATRGQDLSADDFIADYTKGAYDVCVRTKRPDGSDQSLGAFILPGSDFEPNEPTVGRVATVLKLPYGQAWKKSMQIRAGMFHALVEPENDLIIIPGDSLKNKYLDLRSEDYSLMKDGSPNPVIESEIRLLQKLGYAGYKLSSYSDGLTVVGIVALGAKKINILAANADEMPYGLTPIDKRFSDPRAPLKQVAAIDDSKVQAIREELSLARLPIDYARFAAYAMSGKGRSLKKSMDGIHNELIEKASEQGILIKLGYMARGGSIFEVETFKMFHGHLPNFWLKSYGGNAVVGHPTGDNIVANALMGLDGVRPLLRSV